MQGIGVMQSLGWVADQGMGPLFLALSAILLASTELGFRLGLRSFRRRPEKEETRAGIGFVTGGMLGLLAFLLGIALSIAESRHADRRMVVLNEANAIGTAWLRAGVVGGAEGEALQRLFRDYTPLRIAAVRGPGSAAEAERVSGETARLQSEMWAIATRVARAAPTPVSAQLLASLNDVFDLSLSSRLYFSERVPVHILRLLLWTSVISVGAMGYHFGTSGGRQPVMSALLLLLWSSAMVLIVDINRPHQGSVTVSPAPLEWTLQGFGPAG